MVTGQLADKPIRVSLFADWSTKGYSWPHPTPTNGQKTKPNTVNSRCDALLMYI